MQISRVYHRDGHLPQVVTTLTPRQRLAMTTLAAAGMGMAWGVHWLDPDGLEHLIPLALAVIALGMGMGRFVYVIRGHANVMFRLELLGIPILSQVVSAKIFHKMEISEETDGSATLRFHDAANRPRLTLDGFPTRAMAERIGGLFRIDGEKQSVAVERFIEETIREDHWFSRGAAVVLTALVFCVMPGLALLMGWTLDGAIFQIVAGALMVLITTWAVRRDSGIIGVGEDKSHIDRWSRHGWFRIVEYREHLGDDAGQSMLCIRRDRSAWLLPVLALLQAACVFAICHHHTRQAELRASQRHATRESIDSEAVRKGAELLRKHREARDKRE